MEYLGGFTDVRPKGNVDRWQRQRIERLIVTTIVSIQSALCRHGEIHRDEALVNLNHAILQAGADPQFLFLDGQGK